MNDSKLFALRILFPLFILLFIIFPASAQISLEVSITNNNDSIAATATILSVPDSSTLAVKNIIKSNTFLLAEHSRYILRISASGKKTVYKNILTNNKDISLAIALQNNSKQLENVTVASRKPLIRQEDDKTIVDAEPIANTSTNAYEVVEKIPGAVFIEGNVYLNSATPAVIQINGRETKMSAEDISSLLKSLPANSISKIEVLRTPSAKYDAESSGGIINIVLKKGIKLGTNGSANTEYSQGKYATFSTGFNLNNNGKLKKNLSYQFTNGKNFNELSSQRIIGESLIEQSAYTLYPSNRHFLRAAMDYDISKKISIGYNSRISINKNNNSGDNLILVSKNGTAIAMLKSNSYTQNNSNSFFLSNELNLDYKADSIGSEWKNELSWNYFRATDNNAYQNFYLLPATRRPVYGSGNNNSNRNYLVWESDLTWKKIKNITIETGFKISLSNYTNEAKFFIDSTGSMIDDPAKTSTFQYRENINALYLLIARKMGGFTIKPGLRLEGTYINCRQLVPAANSFSIKRTDLFPNLYIRHRLFKIMGMELNANAIFRKSIGRPGYSSLNPVPVRVDEFVYNKGNPALLPQFTTNYELNITADDYPVFSAGINQSKNLFSQVPYQDPVSKIIYTTYDNLGKNKEFYIRGIVGIPPGKKYFFYLGSQHNLNHYDGFYQNKRLNYTNGSWGFFMFQNYKPNNRYTFSLFGFYRLRNLYNFYELEPFGMLNLSINRSFMKGKANITLSGNDLLYTRQYQFSLKQGNIIASGNRREDTRRMTLKFIYNFGIKPKEQNQQQPSFGEEKDM